MTDARATTRWPSRRDVDAASRLHISTNDAKARDDARTRDGERDARGDIATVARDARARDEPGVDAREDDDAREDIDIDIDIDIVERCVHASGVVLGARRRER